MTEALTPQLQERIDRLVARFALIGEQRMRDLPVYHGALVVEATGFRPADDGCIGVLITPWFMNLVQLPARRQEAPPVTGQKVRRELASGPHDFMIGEDEELGRYDFISLASPMFAFEDQAAARAAAHNALEKLLNPPSPEPVVAEQTVHFSASPPLDRKRRAFLGGRLRDA